MRFHSIAAAPGEGAALREQMSKLFVDPPVLDERADLVPVLSYTGGVPGTWVTAPEVVAGEAVGGAGVTVYVHGGGFSQSEPALEEVMALRLSQATGRPVFRVDYRLAPEHPYPAAVEDVVAVHRSLVEQGVPADRILMVGESAGATLVLSALLVLAEAGDALPAGAVSVSPVTDFAVAGVNTGDGRDVMTPETMAVIAEHYLAGAPPDQAPQSPIYGDFRGTPPLLVAVGADELLLDDARRLARAAADAGAEVTLDVYEDMPHAFHLAVLFAEGAWPPVARTFLGRLAEWVRRLDCRRIM
ncbi:alpha/beta hydrolase fold domain-containing protein [Actinomadura kijaniata]|uniref:alpha/beta hydrolase fold domain-containing protein n=1 Tax=Actinomadura kijaniata TaxID=46161 RepID=UPI00082E9B6D|nr:alpha/beta hydrolase fold domain-containing protein [Actinomadura kijaniata]